MAIRISPLVPSDLASPVLIFIIPLEPSYILPVNKLTRPLCLLEADPDERITSPLRATPFPLYILIVPLSFLAAPLSIAILPLVELKLSPVARSIFPVACAVALDEECTLMLPPCP